jgi:tetratricopeptide (TPR) repeat protein
MSKTSTFELEGKEAFHSNKYAKAAKLFGQAKQEYEDLNDVVKSAEMANNQSVSFLQAGKGKQALKSVLGTEEVFELHDEKLQQALAIGNKAAALAAVKRVEEAETAYEKCVEILKELGEDQYISEVMNSLANLRFKDKRQYEAAASLISSVDLEGKPNLQQRFMRFILEKFFKKTG